MTSQEIFEAAQAEMREIIVVPNESLPEQCRQYKEFDLLDVVYKDGTADTVQVFGRTLAELERMMKENTGISDAAAAKAERLRRIELYAQQYEQAEMNETLDEDWSIEYEPEVHCDFAKLSEVMG